MPPKKKTKTEKFAESKKKMVEPEKVEEEEEESEEEEEEETDDEDRGRGKRKRRASSTGYEPEDFTMASERAAAKAAIINKGRGMKLGEIPVVKSAIEKVSTTSKDLPFAYTFVFSTRGKPTKKEMKEKLLEFSGYLPPLPKGKYDQTRQDAKDDEYEEKYAKRAFKLNMSQIKSLCEFFQVDVSSEDGKGLNKEDTIDRLLDFLGTPDKGRVKAEIVNGSPKKSTAKKRKNSNSDSSKKKKSMPTKTKSPVAKKLVVKDYFSLLKNHRKGDKPSDDALRQWVKAYIVCFDMDSATTKHAIRTASDKFGLDLASKKARIKELLAEEM